MSISPAITVIVPAYNAAATMRACVEAIAGQDGAPPFELLVIDDGSTDETPHIAADAGATVISRPRGRPAAARNTGIRAARGGIVAFTDADCVPAPGWLASLIARLADPEVAAVKGAYRTSQRELVARFVQLEYEDKYDLMRGVTAIDFIDTYSAAYRRDVLLAHECFDERFDYLEDQELSFRLAARGCRMVFQPDAIVYHHHAARLTAYTRKKAIIGYWKAQVVRLHPGRAVRDSHTPQIMKVQMGLAALVLGGLGLGAITALLEPWPFPGLPAIALGGASLAAAVFLLTTLPFAAKAWPKDRAVALVSPAILFARAAALGLGYAWGIIKRPKWLAKRASG